MKPWFKLYGAEYLADPKIQRLSAAERSCWITLLCLALIDDGRVSSVDETYLRQRSGIDPASSEWQNTNGILVKFEALGMITMDGMTILVKNWNKRQEVRSESYERVKRWREKRLVTDVALHETARPDQSRQDKTREDAPTNVGLRNSIKEIADKKRL